MGLPQVILLALLATIALVGSVDYTAFNQEKVRRLDCTSCGEECAASCGTKLFRTCCLSFARKRSGGTFTGIDDTGNGSEEDWRSRNFLSAEDPSSFSRLQSPYFKMHEGQSRPKKEWGGPKVVWSLLP